MVIMIHSYNTSCISEYPNPQQQWSSPKPYSSMSVAFVSFSFPSLFRAISILQPKRKPQWRRKPKYWAKSTKPKDPSRIYLLFNLIFFIYYHYFALIQDLIFAFLIWVRFDATNNVRMAWDWIHCNLNEIRELPSRISVLFHHEVRSANYMADALAKQGAQRVRPWVGVM